MDMAKKQTSAQQASFFKQDIPTMPDGYYSSGPNPNLRRFVEEHATPYDPTTDDYDVPPFDQPITTTKATAIYNMHTYWSKKPHDAIRQYIQHYTKPGDLVLDPFCGSGGTALAALLEGHAAIAIDLSPAATFITKGYAFPLIDDGSAKEIQVIERALRELEQTLYRTRCHLCGGPATVSYVVYSFALKCLKCYEYVLYYDCKSVGKGRKKKRICPNCGEEISGAKNRVVGWRLVETAYYCEAGCHKTRISRSHNDPDDDARRIFQEEDLPRLERVASLASDYEIPKHQLPKRTLSHRLRQKNISTIDQLFTDDVNITYARVLRLAAGSCIEDLIKFSLTAMMLNCSKMVTNRDRLGFIKGFYYVPLEFRVQNAVEAFLKKLRYVYEVKSELYTMSQLRSSGAVCISTQSATNLSAIPSNTIDYIFTDPPYADKVPYWELNLAWEHWLGFDVRWEEEEVIVNPRRGKGFPHWVRQMRRSLEEMLRVLKPGRWMSVCYHDSSEGTWALLQDLASEVGFIADTVESALYIDTGQKSYKQKTDSKVTKRDLVVNFRKPRAGEFAQLALLGDEDPATFAEKARAILSESLELHPGSPPDRLYDELVSRMVRKGEFERHDFDALLRSVAENPRGDNHWYLLETADQADAAESAKETAAAAHLEAFMARYRTERPEESGVHYSDLFEQYLPVKDKPRRLLADWLPEFFFKTPEGTWRLPADDEERTQKEALRTSGTLRRIKRFGRALLESVPPADRDRPPNVATAADWVRQCRRAGLYELGRALYEKGGFRFDELGDSGQLEVKEDYQTCVRRS